MGKSLFYTLNRSSLPLQLPVVFHLIKWQSFYFEITQWNPRSPPSMNIYVRVGAGKSLSVFRMYITIHLSYSVRVSWTFFLILDKQGNFWGFILIVICKCYVTLFEFLVGLTDLITHTQRAWKLNLVIALEKINKLIKKINAHNHANLSKTPPWARPTRRKTCFAYQYIYIFFYT